MARDKSFCEKDTLDKITDVFWQQGYNGASMDDLLKQSGLSRSSMYATFGDKRTLFLQSLTTYIDKQKTCITEGAKEWNNTADVVHFLFDYIIDNLNCACARGCFAVNAAMEWGTTDETINTLINQNRDFIIEVTADFIARDQQNGKIPTTTLPHTLATFIFNNLSGLQVGARAGVPKEELIAIRDMVLAMVG